ncbi:SH3 domain-containing protein [Pannonibacter sp. Pt2-lr]
MLKRIVVVLAVLMAGITAASASTVAVSRANVNLRAGPATSYPVVTVVPQGASIVTHGCVNSYTWCDVAYGQLRGGSPPATFRLSTRADLSCCPPLLRLQSA